MTKHHTQLAHVIDVITKIGIKLLGEQIKRNFSWAWHPKCLQKLNERFRVGKHKDTCKASFESLPVPSFSSPRHSYSQVSHWKGSRSRAKSFKHNGKSRRSCLLPLLFFFLFFLLLLSFHSAKFVPEGFKKKLRLHFPVNSNWDRPGPFNALSPARSFISSKIFINRLLNILVLLE